MIISHAKRARCAAADPEGFAHSAAAEGANSKEVEESADRVGCGRDGSPMDMAERRPAIWTYVFACFSAGDHMDLRLCMFERRSDMELRFCISQRRR